MTSPKIVRILNVEPFRVMALWTNGDVRVHDFAEKLPLFARHERWQPLTDFEQFKSVAVGEGDTLYWPSVQFPNTKGQLSPVSFNPDVLFAESERVENPVVEIDTSQEFTQAEYARRKGISPSKVRTWVRRGKLKTRSVPQLGLILVVDAELKKAS